MMEVRDTIDGVEVLFGLLAEFLGFMFEFLEAAFGIEIDGVFGVFAEVELGFKLLGGAADALLKAFEAHGVERV